MTRMTGSVPDARKTMRPRPLNLRSTALTILATLGLVSGSKRRATRTFSSTWGYLGMGAQSSASPAPVLFMTASTCNALIKPSPVVVLSKHRICPEVSPPKVPPTACSRAST